MFKISGIPSWGRRIVCERRGVGLTQQNRPTASEFLHDNSIAAAFPALINRRAKLGGEIFGFDNIFGAKRNTTKTTFPRGPLGSYLYPCSQRRVHLTNALEAKL